MGPVLLGFRKRRLTYLAKCKLVPHPSKYTALAGGNTSLLSDVHCVHKVYSSEIRLFYLVGFLITRIIDVFCVWMNLFCF